MACCPSAARCSVALCGIVKATMHGQTYALPVHALQTNEFLLLCRAWGTRVYLQAHPPEEGLGSRCGTRHRTCRTAGCASGLHPPSTRSTPPRAQMACRGTPPRSQQVLLMVGDLSCATQKKVRLQTPPTGKPNIPHPRAFCNYCQKVLTCSFLPNAKTRQAHYSDSRAIQPRITNPDLVWCSGLSNGLWLRAVLSSIADEGVYSHESRST